jgi:2'-hydroxyisoflavone reductase
MVKAQATGIYNADGPDYELSMKLLLDTCKQVSGSDARFVWIDEKRLIDAGVSPWGEMPLWIPESDPDAAGFFAFSIDKALAAGLTFRPLEETVRDTLAWHTTRPPDHEWRAGLKPEREAELLKAWRENVMRES